MFLALSRYLGKLGFDPDRLASGMLTIVPLLLPSLGLVYHYVGLVGMLSYAILGPVLMLVGFRHIGRIISVGSKLSSKDVILFGLIAVALLILFIALNPMARVNNDRGEALNIAASELIRLRFPYSSKTHLGNRITPLPGGVLLALPFRLWGDVAYMNWFWLTVWFALLAHSYRRTTLASLVLMGTVVASPSIIHEFVTGGDLFANSVAVAACVVLIDSLSRRECYGRLLSAEMVLFAVGLLFGLVLSWRANFLALLPLVTITLWRKQVRKQAIALAAGSSLGFLLVTLPFVIWKGLDAFAPLHAYHKVGAFDDVVPHLGIIVLMVMGASAVLLGSCSRDPYSTDRLLQNCAIVQMVPIVFMVVAPVIERRGLNWLELSYAHFFLYFWVLGRSSKFKQIILSP